MGGGINDWQHSSECWLLTYIDSLISNNDAYCLQREHSLQRYLLVHSYRCLHFTQIGTWSTNCFSRHSIKRPPILRDAILRKSQKIKRILNPREAKRISKLHATINESSIVSRPPGAYTAYLLKFPRLLDRENWHPNEHVTDEMGHFNNSKFLLR